MAKSRAKPAEVLSEAATPYAGNRRAYLLTLYCSIGRKAASFVTVQASHSNEAHRFADLTSAFEYLRSVAQAEGREDKKPDL